MRSDVAGICMSIRSDGEVDAAKSMGNQECADYIFAYVLFVFLPFVFLPPPAAEHRFPVLAMAISTAKVEPW